MSDPIPLQKMLASIIYVNRIGVADPSDMRNCDERIADALLKRFDIKPREQSA
jgi:hypothetical protein